MQYDAFISFREKAELDLEKIVRIEGAIRDQIDMIHHVNEKIAIFEEKIGSDFHRVEGRLDSLERQLNEGIGASGDNVGVKFLIEELKERVE